MSLLDGGSISEDNAFGPETDLILSLLVIVLLVGVLAWFQGKQVVRKKDSIIERNSRTLVFEEKASSFSQGSAKIGAEDLGSLRTKAGTFKEAIRAGKYQYLEIAGAASPETGRAKTGLDVNIRKGYERAEAVAQILNSTGLPFECMKLSSYGRATSEYLLRKMRDQRGKSPADVLREFDGNLQGARLHERQFSGERRTEIWGIPPERVPDGRPMPSVCMSLLSISRDYR